MPAPSAPRWLRILATAALAATVVALLQSINVFFRRGDLGLPPTPWWKAFLLELPVWYSVVVVLPLILLLCNRYPLWPRPTVPHVVQHTVLAQPVVLLSLALMSLGRLFIVPADYADGYWVTTGQYVRGYYTFFLLNYVAVAAIYSAHRHARREQQLAAELLHSRLEQLTAQLQPHFLFNALHGVSALMGESVPASRSMLAQIGDLLRSSLEHEDEQEVPLELELHWLAAYVGVQRYRHPALSVDFEAMADTLSCLVPRFLLQPLVENAVRHGLERPGGRLHVLVSAMLSGNDLRLRVTDDGPGFAQLPPLGGLGLANVEQRIGILYGPDRVYLRNAAGGGAEIELVLPARRASAVRS